MRVQVAIWLAIAGILIGGLVYYGTTHQQGATVQPTVAATAPEKTSVLVSAKPAPAEMSNKIVRVQPDQVLATVNGHSITARDVVPASGTNGEMKIAPQELKFFLDRAVNRELIFEAAQKQGIVLDESQKQQLANMQAMERQREPREIAKLNSDPAGPQLEALDAEAFMLQTAIMAARGASPDVTENQAQEYYQQHQSEFGNLPADPMARDQAWTVLDYQIRTQLAASTRARYNDQLAAYMQQIESEANVVFNNSLQ